MGLRGLLDQPAVYDAKSALMSFGRAPVGRYLTARIDEANPDRVLDVGCGTGRHSERSPRFTCGIDTALPYLRDAVKRRRAVFAAMQAGHLAFRDGVFGLVFCVGLCHHLSGGDVARVVREMKRVTAPGGITLVVDGLLPTWRNPLGHILSRADRGRHVRPLTALAALLEPEGFALACAALPGSYPAVRAAFEHRKPGNPPGSGGRQ